MDKTLIRKRLFVFIELIIFIFFIVAISTRVYISEDKNYYTKDKVALYIMKYDKLPNNFITKEEAKYQYDNYSALIKDNMNIGGNIFENKKHPSYKDWIGNYEEIDGLTLYECDIYLKEDKAELIETNKRGVHRLVYSIDGDFVYYSPNHYGKDSNHGFYELTNFSINKTSNIFFIMDSIIIVLIIGYSCFIMFYKKDNNIKSDIKSSVLTTLSLLIYIVILPFFLIYSLFKKLFTKNDVKQIE